MENLVSKLITEHDFNPLGFIMTNTDKFFRLPQDTQNEVKGKLIADNFKYHYENNEFYRNACIEKGVSPDDVHGFEDLTKIPLIPVKKFKDTTSHVLLSTTLDKIEYEMRSTGTSGIPSVSRRDTPTVNNALTSLYAMYREFFTISTGAILYVMPSTEEIPEMGMIKVLNLLSGLSDASRYCIHEQKFDGDKALATLKEWQGKHTRHIVGPPFLVYKLIKFLKHNDIKLKLDRNSKVINLGGWKRFTGQEIPREEYNELCAEYFGIEENQVRDTYGLVEANCLAVECEHHQKHVAPWVHFSVRDMNDLSKEVPEGQRGVLAILDPTSSSYPTFIMTEDLVYLTPRDQHKGDRISQKMNYISRVRGAEIGCCAINLEKQMDNAEAKAKHADGCVLA